MVDNFPSLFFIGKDENNDFEEMMKKSFRLPLVKEDLLKSIKAKYEYNIFLKKDFDKTEFKKIIEKTKAKKQNIVLFFSDDEVKKLKF